MKRMFSIRVMQALAVLGFVAFMGVSASAQSYQSPAQAILTIESALPGLIKPAVPTSNGTVQPAHNNNFDSKVTSASTLQTMKVLYLQEVLLRLKQGDNTGAAIDGVYGMLQQQLNGRSTLVIDQTRQFVVNLLD